MLRPEAGPGAAGKAGAHRRRWKIRRSAGRIYASPANCGKIILMAGDIRDQNQARQDGRVVAEHVGHHLGQGAAAHLDGHKQRVAHGRGNVADAQVVDQNQAKMDGVHAEGLHDGQEERG